MGRNFLGVTIVMFFYKLNGIISNRLIQKTHFSFLVDVNARFSVTDLGVDKNKDNSHKPNFVK